MASIRKIRTGRWQATVRLPDPVRETNRTRITWSPAGATILVPKDLLSLDAAAELERTIAGLFRHLEG